MKDIYLLANAHIDPVWQWGLDEGIACSIATFTFCGSIAVSISNISTPPSIKAFITVE